MRRFAAGVTIAVSLLHPGPVWSACSTAESPPVTVNAGMEVMTQASFEDSGAKYFFTIRENRFPRYPEFKVWFLERNTPGTYEWPIIARGEYAQRDLVLRGDGLTFAADGFVLDCSVAPETWHLIEKNPLDQERLESVDPCEPTLFYKERSRLESFRPLTCTLATPTMGTLQGGSASYFKTTEYLKTNLSLVIEDALPRVSASRTRSLTEDFTDIEAYFGDAWEFVFVALSHRLPGQPVDRRWFFSNGVFGTDLVFYGSGSFAPGDFEGSNGRVTFTADGYTLDCAVAPFTKHHTFKWPGHERSLRLFDGSPKLSSHASQSGESWLNVDCSLSTPSHGSFKHGIGAFSTFHSRGHANGDF
jgi:hypothetical protein